jgi:hypothetical protein
MVTVRGIAGWVGLGLVAAGAAPMAAQVIDPQGAASAPVAAWEVPDEVGETCAVTGPPAMVAGGRSPTDWLERSWAALRIPEGHVLAVQFMDQVPQIIQSDRTYPPYLPSGGGGALWIDPVGGVTRQSSASFFPGSGSWERTGDRLYDTDGTWVVRDTLVQPVPPLHTFTRRSLAMDPISVLREWRLGSEPRVAGVCRYREDERVVLERDGRWGPERLLLDAESALPVKTDRVEPQFLWGQVRSEVVWATWWAMDSPGGLARYPLATASLQDGAVVQTRAVGIGAWIPTMDAPPMEPPPLEEPMAVDDPGELPSPPVDTVRVADDTFLLVNPWYTEVVTLQGDTVWLLDATLGENRSRQDHEWIRTLFGGDHPVAVVVTDLAWPHIAGIRYWVAEGATIVSDERSEPFLSRVIAREWTLRPDTLEQARSARARPFRFRRVIDSLTLAGGALQLHDIGGIGSEGALMVWMPGADFLWAGDYVQTSEEPSSYAAEVLEAVRRAGFEPERFAAQHHELARWATIEALFGR